MSLIDDLNNIENITNVEREIVDYVLKHKDNIANLNISDLSDVTFTSNATIIRLCRKLGLKGYKEFKINLIQDFERYRSEPSDIDVNKPFDEKQSSIDVMKRIADLSKDAVDTCYESIESENLQKAAKYICEAQRTYIYARGDSLISAMSFSNRLLKLNKITVIANQYDEIAANTYNVSKNDVVLFVSYRGRNVLAEKYLKILRKSGCKIILISAGRENYDFDLTIRFPDKESYSSKIATYYSQLCINYILNCIYGIIFSSDYSKNYDFNKKLNNNDI